MASRWDAIVIGAGFGGMLTAAILARRGARVLVLERESEVGGRLRSFAVDGFVLDNGAYLWPNAHIDTALDAAGATEFVASDVPANRLMRVFVEGQHGKRFTFPWPGRTPSEALLESARVTLRADGETFGALCALWDKLAALPDSTVDALAHVSVRKELPCFEGNARVVEAFRRNVMLFGTYDPDAASMGECIAMRRRRSDVVAKPQCPGANPAGGIRALPLALRSAMQRAGVDLRLGHTVEQVIVEGGRATGVYAHPEENFRERLEASAVVSNVPIWNLFDIVSTRHFPDDVVASGRSYRCVGGTVNVAFAFGAAPRLRETGEEDDFPGWTRLLTEPESEFGGGMVWTTRHSPCNAPEGKHVLQAMRLSPRPDLADAVRVDGVVAAFRRMLDEIYVDATEKLLWARSWTTSEGTEYLVSCAPRPPVRLPVEGLFAVGETTDVPAVQMDAAALSALRCADAIR
jgi:phytoene dehydrogenase-like protein